MALTINVASITVGDDPKDLTDAKAVLAHVFGNQGNIVQTSNQPLTVPAAPQQSDATVAEVGLTNPNAAAMLLTPTPSPTPGTVRQADTHVKCVNTDGRGMFKHQRVGLPDHNNNGQLFTKDCGCPACTAMRREPKTLTYAQWELAAKAEQALYGQVINPNPPAQQVVPQSAPVAPSNVTPLFGNQQASAVDTAQGKFGALFADAGISPTPATPEPQRTSRSKYTPPENGTDLPVPFAAVLEHYVNNTGPYAPVDGQPQGLVNLQKRQAVAEYVMGRRGFSTLGSVHEKLPTQVTRQLVKAGAGK